LLAHRAFLFVCLLVFVRSFCFILPWGFACWLASLSLSSLQIVANAAVQSIRFLKGAVSVATLPEPYMPEVALIGRSNVGKSSLVNMVMGRKAMAYTSKTPGKTQQVWELVLCGSE